MLFGRSKTTRSFQSRFTQLTESRNSQLNEGYKGDPTDLQALFDAVETAALAAFGKNDATVTVVDNIGTAVVVSDNAKVLKTIDSLCNELVDEDNTVDYTGKQGSVVETKNGCDVKIGKGGLAISVDARSHVATITKTFKWAKKGMVLPGKLFV